MPVGSEWLGENKMRDPHYFRQPGKRDNKREAESFNPEDHIRFTLNVFHKFYCACTGIFCPEKAVPGSGSSVSRWTVGEQRTGKDRRREANV